MHMMQMRRRPLKKLLELSACSILSEEQLQFHGLLTFIRMCGGVFRDTECE